MLERAAQVVEHAERRRRRRRLLLLDGVVRLVGPAIARSLIDGQGAALCPGGAGVFLALPGRLAGAREPREAPGRRRFHAERVALGLSGHRRRARRHVQRLMAPVALIGALSTARRRQKVDRRRRRRSGRRPGGRVVGVVGVGGAERHPALKVLTASGREVTIFFKIYTVS